MADNKTPFGQTFGGGLAGQAIGAGLGLLLQGHNDRRQLKQQEKLNAMQLGTDIQKMDYQYGLQKRMWEETNYAAQMEQLKKAGLNPSLMYGQAGGGGTTGSAGGGVSAPNAPAGGGEIMGLMMAKAQMDLIAAQTKKTEAEANTIEGSNERGKLDLKNIAADIKNKEASSRLTNVDADLREVQMNFTEDAYDENLSILRNAARQGAAAITIIENDASISTETKNDKIAQIKAAAIGTAIGNEMMKSGIKVNEAQINKMSADIAQGWRKLSIDQQNAVANMLTAKAAETNANTNIRQFLETVRNNDMTQEMKQAVLSFEKAINDVPESTKMTVGSLTNIMGAGVLGKLMTAGRSSATISGFGKR